MHANTPASNGHVYPHRIHITGAPRSGTTLMLALILTCFDVDGGIERESRLWRAPVRGRRVVVTKQPADEKLALFLSRLDRKLHVIYMLRDPREVVVSRHGSAPDRYWTNLRAWRESVAVTLPYERHPRLHIVRYEDLMRNADAVQQSLATVMPFLHPLHPFSEFHDVAELRNSQWRAAMGQIRGLKRDATPSWHGNLPRLKGQIARHGGVSEDLVRLGYEPDNTWIHLMDGATADMNESHSPERESFRRRFDHGWRDFLGAMAYVGQRVAVWP